MYCRRKWSCPRTSDAQGNPRPLHSRECNLNGLVVYLPYHQFRQFSVLKALRQLIITDEQTLDTASAVSLDATHVFRGDIESMKKHYVLSAVFSDCQVFLFNYQYEHILDSAVGFRRCLDVESQYSGIRESKLPANLSSTPVQ
jgi:hypothetical protein